MRSERIYPVEKYGAVFDAHVHSYFDYHDGMMSPSELVKCTIRKRFNFVLAMSHDTCRGNLRIERAAKDAGLPCLWGIEVSTIHNHILGYGVNEWKYRRDCLTPEEAIDYLREQDAAVFLAHPGANPMGVRYGKWYPRLAAVLDIDGIEWYNATVYIYNAATRKMFDKFPEGRRIAGTDAHHPSCFGYAFTQVDINSDDPDDIVTAMKKGRCRPYGMPVPVYRFLYSVILQTVTNKLIGLKKVEGRVIRATGDRPGSSVPDSITDHDEWIIKILMKKPRKDYPFLI